MTSRLLAFAASLRKGSLNRKLIGIASPDLFALPAAGLALGGDGALKHSPTRERLEKLVAAYLEVARKLAQQG